MKTLAIDIETFSDIDLRKSGVYPYAESDEFEILLFAYSVDSGPVEVVDFAMGEDLPDEILKALTNPDVMKTAFNASFERVCIASHFGIYTDPKQWECTMVHALTLGLPGNLAGAAKALRIEEQKDSAGSALINYFSKPCKPTKANGERTRNLYIHDLERWQEYKDYNVQDVVVELAIKEKLSKFEPSAFEKKLWELDQRINDKGILLDKELIQNAIIADAASTEVLLAEAIELTGLPNPNSTAQLKKWVEDRGIEMPNVQAETVEEMIKVVEDETVKRALELRQEMSKTSVKKYYSMDHVRGKDGRGRGVLQFYGANRTGRWAGRLIQVQNLPNMEMNAADIAIARELLRKGDMETLGLFYDRIPDVLSQLLRTALIAESGHRFIVSDFSAIEARVIAWYAAEQWRLDVFNGHGKIYEASAAQMFNVPIEEVTRENGLRDKGKVAELALGYQGAVGALMQMGAEEYMNEAEMVQMTKTWRAANPNIVKFWYAVGDAALKAVRDKEIVNMQFGLQFYVESGILFIKLPSGRRLSYIRPRIKENKFGRDAIHFDGARSEESTYGGKLVENIVQATARDLLAEALVRVDEADYDIVFHVHDEIVTETPIGTGSIEEVDALMGQSVEWAPGLPLGAAGFETDYYIAD